MADKKAGIGVGVLILAVLALWASSKRKAVEVITKPPEVAEAALEAPPEVALKVTPEVTKPEVEATEALPSELPEVAKPTIVKREETAIIVQEAERKALESTTALPVTYALELSYFDILSVDGRGFVEIGRESECTLYHFYEYLLLYEMPDPPSKVVRDSKGLIECILAQGVDPCTASREELTNALKGCSQYLTYDPETAASLMLYLWFDRYRPDPSSQIPYAALAEPFVMSTPKDITIRYYQKRELYGRESFATVIKFEPQELLNLYPFPAQLRGSFGGGTTRPGEYTTTFKYHAGFWAPGTYNAMLSAPWEAFRIKNFALMTRAGGHG